MYWFVYVENINKREIEKYNIFDHDSFMNDVKDAYKKYKDDFESFAEKVKHSLMYYFWSKCEWEIILSDWPPSDKFKEKKINVYDQIMLNWDIFINYVWKMSHMRKNAKSN